MWDRIVKQNQEEFKQERKGFPSMIASSQFSNLQLGNLARNSELTFNFGNFQNWKLSILAIFNSIHQKY